MSARYQVITEASGVSVIRDTHEKQNFCILCEGMMGVKQEDYTLAERICDWLNKQEDKE